MLEEFRRRKNLKNYYDLMKKRELNENTEIGRSGNQYMDMDKDTLVRDAEFASSGPERFFEA